MLYYHKKTEKKLHLKNWKIEGKPCWNYRNPHKVLQIFQTDVKHYMKN